LIEANNRLSETGDTLVLTRPQENVQRVFEVTGLADWISPWDPDWLAPETR
jgi:hypothetical protein